MIDSLERIYVVCALLYLSGAFLPILSNDPGGSSIEMRSDPYLLLLQGIVYFGMLLFILPRFRNFLFVLTRSTWVVLLVGLALPSTLWSGDADLTLRRSVVVALTAAFGIYFASRFSIREQLGLVAISTGVAIVFSIGCALLFPKFGMMHGVYEGVWKGVFVHKNALGREMAFGCVVFAVLRSSDCISKRIRRLGFGSSAAVLVLSRSRTAFVALLPLLLFIWISKFVRLKMRTVARLALAGACVLSAITPIVMDDDYRAALLQVIGRNSTISGRTFLWSTIMTSIMKHPWLGYGFGSFWQGTKGPSIVILNAVHWDVAHAHNGFLDLWIDIGFLGLTVFLIGYGISCYRAFHIFRNSDEQETVWPLVFLAFLLVFNFTESAILHQNNLFLALYVAVYAQTAIQYRAVQSSEDEEDGLESQGTLPSLAMDVEPAS